MTTSSLTTFFLISGMVFLMIAVVGQSRLGFAEIKPGCFGRFLAVIIGIFSLICAVLLVTFPPEILDFVKNYLAQQLQQNQGFITKIYSGF